MLHLANDQLRVDVLDPTADRERFGPRFCTGAYVWEVADQQAGALLSGPEGDEPNPDPFNGHGLPEACRDRARSGHKWLWAGDEGFAPGVGTLGRDAEGNVTITRACTWHIDAGPERMEFRSRHQAAGYDAMLTRTLTLEGRVLRSTSELTNQGDKPMELEWFVHPFFALNGEGLFTATLPASAHIPADCGFDLEDSQLSGTRRYIGKDDGAFALLEGVTGSPLTVNIAHPALADGINFSTDFALSECPIWVNGFTFSIEPYQRISLARSESHQWELRYGFSALR